MTDFITGALNAYYSDAADLEIGMPAFKEEVYARSNPAGDRWTVYQMTHHPVLPDGLTLPVPLALLFAETLAFGMVNDNATAVLAESVSREQAIAMVRDHEENPRTHPAYPLLRQQRKPEDSATHWHHTL